MTPLGTPTEWSTLENTFEAKKTQGRYDATREENIHPGTQSRPQEAATPPGTPTEWEALKTAIDAERPQGMADATREENADPSS